MFAITTSLCILDLKVPNNVNNIVQPVLTANSLQQQPPFYNYIYFFSG